MEENSNINSNGLYTIKEVSDLTDIPVHTLRFWERVFKGYITPIRTNGGHRRYSSETISLIKNIKAFVYEKGYTLNGALNELKLNITAGNDFRKRKDIEILVDEIAEMIKKRILQDVR